MVRWAVEFYIRWRQGCTMHKLWLAANEDFFNFWGLFWFQRVSWWGLRTENCIFVAGRLKTAVLLPKPQIVAFLSQRSQKIQHTRSEEKNWENLLRRTSHKLCNPVWRLSQFFRWNQNDFFFIVGVCLPVNTDWPSQNSTFSIWPEALDWSPDCTSACKKKEARSSLYSSVSFIWSQSISINWSTWLVSWLNLCL